MKKISMIGVGFCVLVLTTLSQQINSAIPKINMNVKHSPCPEKDDPKKLVIFASDHTCEEYYICAAGIPHLQICINGLQYEKEHRRCDIPEKVKCEIPPPPETVQCPNEPGRHMFPHPYDCQLHYVCNGLDPVLRRCLPGLNFNPAIPGCAPADSFECFDDNEI